MIHTMRIDGATLTVRPVEPSDDERLLRMFGRLSPRSIYFRFFSPINRLSRQTLLTLVDVDHWRSDALVALDGDEIVAVARYNSVRKPERPGSKEAEIALTVEDAWQHCGIGRRLGRALGALAAQRGYAALVVTILPENREALALLRDLVPDANVRFADGVYHARLPLPGLRLVHHGDCAGRRPVPVAARSQGGHTSVTAGPRLGAGEAGRAGRPAGQVR